MITSSSSKVNSTTPLSAPAFAAPDRPGQWPRSSLSAQSLKNNSGQSVVEFMLVISIVIFFLFFHVNLSIVYAIVNYMDYAAYMSARALQLGNVNPEKQYANALFYASHFKKKNPFGSFLKINDVKIGAQDKNFFKRSDKQSTKSNSSSAKKGGTAELIFPDGKAIEGVSLTYTVPFFIVPLFGISSGEVLQNLKFLNLTSEAFFHREPTQSECKNFWVLFNETLQNSGLPGVRGDGENPNDVKTSIDTGLTKNGDLEPYYDDGC